MGIDFLWYISLFIHLLIYFCHAENPTHGCVYDSQELDHKASPAMHLKCILIYYFFRFSKHSFQLFSSSRSSILKSIPRSKNCTEQQEGSRESQSDDVGERLFFLRSMSDEALKDQKAFAPFALDRLKDQVQPFLLIKISQTFILVLFPHSTTKVWGMLHILALSMLGLQSFRYCKQPLIMLVNFGQNDWI